MKNTFKRAISILLVAVMLFGTSPLAGFVGLDLPELDFLSTEAEAAGEECTHPEDKLTWETYAAPSCVPGIDFAVCGACGASGKSELEILCNSSTYPESAHNYANNTNRTWSFSYEGANKLVLKFSSSTKTENGYDYIYIYDAIGTQVGVYSGAKLSGKVLELEGSSFKIRLTSNRSTVSYGFKFDSITAKVFEGEDPALTRETAATGIHNFPSSGGACSVCGVVGGGCGTNLKWAFDAETGELAISGTGAMKDYNKTSKNSSYVTTAPWQQYTSSIKSVTISDGVTSIGKYAFYKCGGFTSITIPASVTSIGEEALSYCGVLEDVYYTGDVAGWCAIDFYHSSSNPMYYAENVYINGVLVKDLVIPEGVITIGDYAFYGCNGLTSVTIPDSVTTIGNYAFSYCDSLTSVTIGNGVTSIGSDAFYGCTSLTSVTIPDSVTTIGSYAFSYCDSLTSVTIPDSVTTIGSYAFYNCTSLASITIPDSVTSIDYRAFYNCTSLENTYYIGTAEQWANVSVGYDNDSLTENLIFESDSAKPYYGGKCGENLIWKIYVGGTELIISGTGAMTDYDDTYKNGTYVTTAPWEKYSSSIKTVTISDGVTSIGKYAFYNYDGFTSITIPASVTTIGAYAFISCDSLENVYYTGDVAGWCAIDFYYPTSNPMYYAENLYINGSLVEGDLVIPDGITAIGSSAFYNCTSLTSVTIPDSVTSIGFSAFYGCESLTSVTIPDSVISIGNSVFYGCTSLTNAYYKGTLEQWATVSVGSDNGSLTENLIFECDSAKPYYGGKCGENLTWKIYVGSTELIISGTGAMTNYDDTYKNGTYVTTAPWQKQTSSIKTVTISDGVTNIGSYAFYKCYDLESVTIPVSITSIGNYAFYNCDSLENVTIPVSITSIGDRAFYYCDSLENAYYKETSEQWANVSVGTNNGSLTENLIFESDSAKPYYGGKCGENLTWKIYVGSTELIISGTGAMTDYYKISKNSGYVTTAPWQKQTSSIKTVTISDGVTTIGEDAFYNCDSLASVTIPDSVTTIGDSAFCGCESLTSVTIPASVTSIGSYAFSGCESLTSVTIPDSVTTIGNSAFSGCNSLASVTIGSGVITIGEKVFYNCTSLASVIIPDSVTSIGSSAFYYCTSLESVTIPAIVTSIGEYAFYYCGVLEDVYYTGNVAGWCAIDFYHSYSNPMLYAENLYINGALVKDLVIPEGVTTIGSYAFSYCDSLVSVRIPEGVTNIGNYAFYYCTSLASITIPVSVTSIGNSAFSDCNSLAKAYYKETVEQWAKVSVGSYNGSLTGSLIFECDSAKPYYGGKCGENLTWKIYVGSTELIISGTGEMNHYGEEKSNSTYIDTTPWYRHRSSVKMVTISDGVTSIGNFAFYYFENLIKATIGSSVTSIGIGAFYSCINLKTVTIPDGVTTVGNRAFSGCTSLAVIEIPDSVTSIGNSAFYGCRNADKITIGKGVTSIGKDAFSGCYGVKSITVDAANTAYVSDNNGVLFNKDKTVLLQYPMGSSTKSYNIPNGVKTIASGAFEGAAGSTINTYDLTYITIPNSVTTIEDSAFYCCRNLALLDIPDSVTTIGDSAFFACTRLSEIKIGSGVKELGDYAFAGNILLVNVIIKEGITTLEPDTFYLCAALKNVSIPRSVDLIKASAFNDCNNIKNVYYAGSKSEWEQVVVGGDNGSFSSAKMHYNSIGSSISGGSTEVPDNTPTYDSSVTDAALVAEPSQAKISYGDSIVLHVDPAKIPTGGKVQWYLSNGNFSHTVSSDSYTCTITPEKSGDTTVTAIVYDAEGNVVSADKQTLASKAGFFDKIIAFFKKLFGLTEVYDQY